MVLWVKVVALWKLSPCFRRAFERTQPCLFREMLLFTKKSGVSVKWPNDKFPRRLLIRVRIIDYSTFRQFSHRCPLLTGSGHVRIFLFIILNIAWMNALLNLVKKKDVFFLSSWFHFQTFISGPTFCGRVDWSLAVVSSSDVDVTTCPVSASSLSASFPSDSSQFLSRWNLKVRWLIF